MAQAGSKDLAGIRSIHDEEQSYNPNDTNIAKGLCVVFDNTSGDNRSIVRPDNALALLSGRAFAGISANEGSPVLAQDTAWAVQRSGIADCLLVDSTACTRGQIAAYDPTVSGAQAGRVQPYTSAIQVPIGRFQQTQSAGTNVMVGVALFAGTGSAPAISLIGKIAGPSAVLTNINNTETVYNKNVSVPANLLTANSVLRISGLIRCVNAGANATILRVRFGGVAGALVGLTASLTPNNNDICPFELYLDVRSSTAAMVYGNMGGFGAVSVATQRSQGSAAVVIDTTVANTVVATAIYAAASANDQTQLESLAVEILTAAA